MTRRAELENHRKRFGMRSMIAVGAACGLVSAAGTFFWLRGSSAGSLAAPVLSSVKQQYLCPMHPTIVQDHPSDCPICGMKLVQVERNKDSMTNLAAADEDRKIAFYRSPMNPALTSSVPRKDEMGMDYLPVYENETNNVSGSIEGRSVVGIDPERQQLIGLRTAEVVRGRVGGQVRTVGRVVVDETQVRRINVKIAGFADHIFVDFVGKRVHLGDPLFQFYSPELLAAQQDYLLALRTRSFLAKAQGAASENGQALVDAAQRRLKLWDVSASEIRRIEETGQPTKTLTFYSPVAGVVTKKDVVEGMRLDAGAMPYEIVDLSTVWVLADVYESELRFVKQGALATLTLKAFPGRVFEGKVIYLDPVLDPQAHTVKARLTFPNPSGDLRPEMFGEVVLKVDSHQGLLLPADAVVDSGTAKVVFVAQGEGKFQPRRIEVGQSDGSVVEVTSGLQEGEHVVTRANFLIDSESRLRASLNSMSPAGKQPESARVLLPSGSPSAEQAAPAGQDAMPGHEGQQP